MAAASCAGVGVTSCAGAVVAGEAMKTGLAVGAWLRRSGVAVMIRITGWGVGAWPKGRLHPAGSQQGEALIDLGDRELEPELRRLVHDLEQQLVAVHPLVRALLERQQLLHVEVALVVGARLPRQDRAVERRLPDLM